MADDFPRFFKKLEKILLKPLSKKSLDGIGNAVIKNIRDRTDRGQTIARGRVEGLAPLKDSTKARKRRLGQPTRPRLRDTGQMMRSLKTRTNVRKQTVVVEPRFKKEKQKAEWAHEGSTSSKNGPREPRPFIPITDKLDTKTQKEVEDILVKELDRQLRKL